MYVTKTDVRTASLRLFRKPTPSFAAESGATAYEAQRREIPSTRRTDEEILATPGMKSADKLQRAMARLGEVGRFTGVLALSYEDEIEYDSREVLDSRAFAAGITWGVVTDHPGQGGSITGRRPRGAEVLRLQQVDMHTRYRDSGIEGALISGVIEASEAPIVGVDVPADNEFARVRYEQLGMRVVGSTVDRNYYGRRANPATILHFEGDAEQVMDVADQWTPTTLEVLHETAGHIPLHILD